MSAITLASAFAKVTTITCDVCGLKSQYIGIGAQASRSDLKQIGWSFTKPNRDVCTECVNKSYGDERVE